MRRSVSRLSFGLVLLCAPLWVSCAPQANAPKPQTAWPEKRAGLAKTMTELCKLVAAAREPMRESISQLEAQTWNAQLANSWMAEQGLIDAETRAKALRELSVDGASWPEVFGKFVSEHQFRVQTLRNAYEPESFRRRWSAALRLQVRLFGSEDEGELFVAASNVLDSSEPHRNFESSERVELRMDECLRVSRGASRLTLGWGDVPPDFEPRTKVLVNEAGERIAEIVVTAMRLGTREKPGSGR